MSRRDKDLIGCGHRKSPIANIRDETNRTILWDSGEQHGRLSEGKVTAKSLH